MTINVREAFKINEAVFFGKNSQRGGEGSRQIQNFPKEIFDRGGGVRTKNETFPNMKFEFGWDFPLKSLQIIGVKTVLNLCPKNCNFSSPPTHTLTGLSVMISA